MTDVTGDEPDDRIEELARELREALAPLGGIPPAPTWLSTKLTAEFRRRRGELAPQREVRLTVASDTRATGLVGVRAGTAPEEQDYTIHLRPEHDGAGPEVVLDVRTEAEAVAVDGLVFGGGGTAYHVRTTSGPLVRDADDTAGDGRFSFRGLPPGRHRLVLDDGHDLLTAELDLSTGGGPDDTA